MVTWLTDLVAAQTQTIGLGVWPPISFVYGPIFPEHEYPEVLGVYTQTSGAAEESEGIVQRPGFQIRIRGLYDQVPALGQIANTIDLALIQINTEDLWGTRVLDVDRTGGMPAPLVDDERGRRVSFTCNYIIREAVQIGSP
jgi:hypothetical protein